MLDGCCPVEEDLHCRVTEAAHELRRPQVRVARWVILVGWKAGKYVEAIRHVERLRDVHIRVCRKERPDAHDRLRATLTASEDDVGARGELRLVLSGP